MSSDLIAQLETSGPGLVVQRLRSMARESVLQRLETAEAAVMAGDLIGQLDNRAAALRAAIDAETQRRMAGRHGRDRVAEYAVPKLPEQMSFLHSGARDLAQIRRTVQPLARLLAARLEIRRRRARHGPVDVRRTLRASMSTGGVPIKLTHRRPRPGRPELVIICDV